MIRKIGAYLGFCIRSGKIVYGVDEIEKQKKAALILIDEELGESSKKSVVKAKEKFAAPLLVVTGGVLGELLHKPAVKAVAIKEKNLASAILSAAEGSDKFKSMSSGGND
ncbi:MAG: hypothetical protein IJX81_05080 [Clostridia bacterium]|nr:hypothetical protein [Clostridia bacterium]